MPLFQSLPQRARKLADSAYDLIGDPHFELSERIREMRAEKAAK
jgi:hypothetical protein